ncbi:alpha/beta hydrolase, partial [Patulibacter sp. S7RM1-6]
MLPPRRLLLPAVVAAALAAPATAAAEHATVRSFDGVAIDADFQPADGLRAGQRAPTIVMTHGFGATRETVDLPGGAASLGQVASSAFRAHGYNTLVFDSRGFGRSGGEVQLDSPDYEGRDVSALLDWLARRPEAQLDGAGDPRVGMHGASYGGGVQWAAASRDRRIDALAPAISWTSLVQALGRDGRLKLGWGLPLVGLGVVSSTALGVFAPQGLELGGFPPQLTGLAVAAAVTGRSGPELTAYLRDRSTGDAVANVRAPSLILQGTADTLFSPSQSLDMRRLLRKARTPTKVLWFCGGHGVCRTGNALGDRIEPRVLAWMDRWLRDDRGADVGPGFEWVADDGKVRSAADFPLKSAGTITASGSGTLPVTPLSTVQGLVIAATPAASAVNVDVPRQDGERDVVGEPVVRLRYRGTAAPTSTHLYGQLLDVDRGVVVGNQATPIPVMLDGREHEVETRLEAVAMRVTPSSRYRLQITDGSNVYGLTLSAGAVDLRDVRLELPVGDAAGTRSDEDAVAPPVGAAVVPGATAVRGEAERRRAR